RLHRCALCPYTTLFRSLLVYGVAFFAVQATAVSEAGVWPVVLAATVSAFIGSYAGSRYLKKIRHEWVQALTAVMLGLVGLGLARDRKSTRLNSSHVKSS